MPELPEVETVRRSLLEYLPAGVRWVKVELRRKDLRIPFPKDLRKKLVGESLTTIDRRAKYLLFQTEHFQLLNHLGMSGSWRALGENEELKKHDHLIFEFDNGVRLAYHDPRRFGVVDWGGIDSPWLKNLGVEPLTSEFNARHLKSMLRGKSTPIKVALMDPKVVVGVGNIYASEILFAAKVNPNRLAKKVKDPELKAIVKWTKVILKKSIKAKGSTLKDHKLVSGESGGYQSTFNVYSRSKELCLDCGTPIRAKVMAQRSTFWCPHCQK